MKRRLIALLVASIFLVQMNDISNAAVKAGSACTKLNSTSTSGGYKYTCIKSGKKLVWSKGVKVPTPTPTPTPTSTSTPLPSETPTSLVIETPPPLSYETVTALPSPSIVPEFDDNRALEASTPKPPKIRGEIAPRRKQFVAEHDAEVIYGAVVADD